jgi:hypothetical protein
MALREPNKRIVEGGQHAARSDTLIPSTHLSTKPGEVHVDAGDGDLASGQAGCVAGSSRPTVIRAKRRPRREGVTPLAGPIATTTPYTGGGEGVETKVVSQPAFH